MSLERVWVIEIQVGESTSFVGKAQKSTTWWPDGVVILIFWLEHRTTCALPRAGMQMAIAVVHVELLDRVVYAVLAALELRLTVSVVTSASAQER